MQFQPYQSHQDKNKISISEKKNIQASHDTVGGILN